MMMIEISEHKLDKATDYAEKMLKYGGMLMQCLSEWGEESGMNHREGGYGMRDDYSRYSSRGGYGSRYGGGSSMGYRDYDDWEEMEERPEEMGERRRRRSNGRYY